MSFRARYGRCPICGADGSGAKPLVWDHNHDTGSFRAYICGRCNTGLGLFKDSPALLRSAIEYLHTHGCYGDPGDDFTIIPSDFLAFLLGFCPRMEEAAKPVETSAAEHVNGDEIDIDELHKRLDQMYGGWAKTWTKKCMELGMPYTRQGRGGRYLFAWHKASEWLRRRFKECPDGENVFGAWDLQCVIDVPPVAQSLAEAERGDMIPWQEAKATMTSEQ